MLSNGLLKWIVAGAIALSAGTVVASTVHRVKHSTPTHKSTAAVTTSHKATPAMKHATAAPKKASAVTHKTVKPAAKKATSAKLSTKTGKTSTKLSTKAGKTSTKLATHTTPKATAKKTTVSTHKKTYGHTLPMKSSKAPTNDKMPWVY